MRGIGVFGATRAPSDKFKFNNITMTRSSHAYDLKFDM